MARSILRRAAAWKATEDARGQRDAEGVALPPRCTRQRRRLPRRLCLACARAEARARAGFRSRVPPTREGAGTAPMARPPLPPAVTRTTLTLHLSIVPRHAETAA